MEKDEDDIEGLVRYIFYNSAMSTRVLRPFNLENIDLARISSSVIVILIPFGTRIVCVE